VSFGYSLCGSRMRATTVPGSLGKGWFRNNNQVESHRAIPCIAAAQLFLTQGALFVLVLDIFAYSETQTRENALEQWLDILQSRVPGSVVLLVGTHADKFASSADCDDRMELVKKGVCHRVGSTSIMSCPVWPYGLISQL